ARRGGRPGSSSVPQRLEDDRVDPLDAVDALLQVLVAGPREEGLVELAFVAEAREPLTELACQLVVDLHPEPLRRLSEDLLMETVDAAELLQRALVVFDPQLDEDVGEPGVAAVLLHDEQR